MRYSRKWIVVVIVVSLLAIMAPNSGAASATTFYAWETLGPQQTGPGFVATVGVGGSVVLATENGLARGVERGENGTWAFVTTGLGPFTNTMAIAADPTNSDRAFLTAYDGGSPPTAAGIFRSVDAGLSWTMVNAWPRGTIGDPVSIEVSASGIVYVGLVAGTGNMLRSTDSGASWTPLLFGPPVYGVDVVETDPLAPSIVYAGARNPGGAAGSHLYKSVNAGDTWVQLPDVPVQDGQGIRCIAVGQSAPSSVFVGAGPTLYRSDNGGLSWVSLVGTGGLPVSAAFWSVLIDGMSIYASAPQTFYWSENAGASWASTYIGPYATALNFAVDTLSPRSLYAFEFENVCRCFVPSFALVTSGSPSGGGSVARSPDQLSYAPGSAVQLTAIPVLGWHFTGWSGDLTGTANPTTVTMDANKTVTATFAIDTHTLSTGQIGSGSVSKSPSQATYDYGTVVQLTATPDPGWHFVSWSGDLAGSASPGTITMDADKTVIASFSANVGAVTISSGGNGTVTPTTPVLQTYGATGTTITATPATGYHFVSWSATSNSTYVSVADVSSASTPFTTTSSMPDGGTAIITANFAIDTYSLTTNVVGSGSVARSPDLGVYAHGTSVQLTAIPTFGWHFTGWSGDLTGTANPATITMDANKTVAATFAPNTYIITASAGPNGSITPSGSVFVSHGASQSFSIMAEPGYHVQDVSVDGVSQGAVSSYTFTNVTAGHSIAATFAINTYVVTVTVGPHGKIVPGTGPVPHHATKVFNVNPDAGYLVEAVSVDGVLQNDAAGQRSYVVTLKDVEGPHTLVATFRPVPDTSAPTIALSDFSKMAGVIGWSGGTIHTFTVRTSPFMFTFMVDDDSGSAKWTIVVNGRVIVDSIGAGSVTYPVPLAEGRNDADISASDAAGNYSSQKLVIYLDSTGPALTFSPALPTSVTSPNLVVAGSATDAVSGLKSIIINGAGVVPFLDGSFHETLILAKGLNKIDIEAEDKSGNRTSRTLTVTYAAPSLPAARTITLTIGKATMDVNGAAVALDAAPVIQNSRTLLPLRALIETLGGKVTWNASTRMATVTLGSRTVAVTIGSPVGLVGGKKTAIDPANSAVVPIIINGRTFLPLRFIGENLGLDLAWEPMSQTVSFTYWP